MSIYDELQAAGLLPKEVEWVREVAPGIHRDRALAAINALAAVALELDDEVRRLDSWDGHLRWLDKWYPPATFDGSSGDPGPTIVKLTRELAAEKARAGEADGMVGTLKRELDLADHALEAANERADAWHQQRDAAHEAWAEAVERAEKTEAALREAEDRLCAIYELAGDTALTEDMISARRAQSHA